MKDRRRPTHPGSIPTPDVLRLLIVDDDPDYGNYVAALTRRLGFAVDVAADGEASLVQLKLAPYDVVVVDYEMPRMNGLELIAQIRAQDSLKGLYAVMLTAHDEMETKLSALRAGYDDFLTKGSSELEISAKLVAARRIATRQHRLDVAVREWYGLATRDELTGVFNRRFFSTETERLLTEQTKLSVVLFDLDDFKSVNDRYGHLAGDRVLRDVGALFQRSTRAEDLIARYGGDEFVMVVSGLEPSDVERISERLARDVRSLQWLAGEEPFSIGVTIGIASSQLLSEPTLPRLLGVADRDLYKNKWVRTHPDQRPELYEYPVDQRRIDLVIPIVSTTESVKVDEAALPPLRLQRKQPDAT